MAEIDPDELSPWITTLRGRLVRGDLDALGQVQLNEEARADASLIAQIMLDELDALEQLPPDERDSLDAIVERRSLLWDLCWLRGQIG